MGKVMIKHLLNAGLSVFLASLLIFGMVRLSPVDPIQLMVQQPGGAASRQADRDQQIEALREEYGLNDDLLTQYKNWAARASRLDFGQSIVTREPIRQALRRTLKPTLVLAFASVGLEFILALAGGILAVLFLDRLLDQLIQVVGIALRSIPFFALAIYSLQLFSVKWHLYPLNNQTRLNRLWLPVLVIAITQAPRLSALIRNQLLNELSKTYILDAMAKGYPKSKLLKEALRNSLLPIWTSVSLSLASSIGGLVVSENLFAWPGLGNYGMTGVLKLDYPVVQAYLLVVVVLILIISGLGEFIYSLLDPSLRKEGVQS